jgi:hypothetical protein
MEVNLIIIRRSSLKNQNVAGFFYPVLNGKNYSIASSRKPVVTI